MGLVNFVISTVGKCMDAVCLLLDLNFIIVHSVVRALLAIYNFIFNLPSFLMNSTLQLGNLFLVWMMLLADVASNLGQGTITFLVNLVLAVEGLLESLKMIGYLSVHVLLRGKEQLYRGLVSLMEGCGIAVSLVVYFTNTVVNFALIATQNAYQTVVGVCQTVSGPLQKILEFTLTSFTFLYSCMAATLAFLWCPFKLVLDFLVSLVHIFISVFMLNAYGILLTVSIALIATIFLNPGLSRQAAVCIMGRINSLRITRRLHLILYFGTVSMRNGYRSLRRNVQHLQYVVNNLHLFERGIWRQLSRHSEQLSEALRLHLQLMDNNGEQRDANPVQQDPPGERAAAVNQIQPTNTLVIPSTSSPVTPSPEEDSTNLPTECLLSLLKEQEERKKCVICQDCTKTVVLLPCRHLCLCKDCKAILMNQPIYHHNCPLCRQMILNTMDVYL